MDKIEEKIWSYSDYQIPKFSGGSVIEERFDLTSVSKVRFSNGHKVENYRKLIKNIAIIAGKNSKFDLFFRGQVEDFKDRNGRSVIYPTICRPARKLDGTYEKKIYTKTILNRFKELLSFSDYIKKVSFYRNNFYEYYFALIQHYQILQTPLIDITQSIRAACSFALDRSKSGFIYVFGLPYPQGSISHYIDQKMVLVKLQSVCPADSKRPHYQEGFLVGRLPFHPRKEAGDNLSIRLIAKFLLDNSKDTFWDSDFTPMPHALLYPDDDDCEKAFLSLYENFKKTTKY